MYDDDRRNNPTTTEPAVAEGVVDRYRPLVLAMIRSLSNQSHQAGVDFEDLFQEANAALIELSGDYAPERGVSFGAYLRLKLKWHLVNFLGRELRRKNRTVGIEESMIEHLAEETAAFPSAEVLNPRLRAALRRLSPKQRSVLYGIYWREKTANELALQLGVSAQNVTALRRRAEAAIRQEMNPPGGEAILPWDPATEGSPLA